MRFDFDTYNSYELKSSSEARHMQRKKCWTITKKKIIYDFILNYFTFCLLIIKQRENEKKKQATEQKVMAVKKKACIKKATRCAHVDDVMLK